MQCKEWDDANSELFKESHDEAVHKNSYKSRLYELISASLNFPLQVSFLFDKIEKLEYKYTCPWISYLCPLTGWLREKKRAEVINRRFLLCQLYP